MDFAQARQMMVDGQVRTNDITVPGLIAAILDTPREAFLPAHLKNVAYLDRDTPFEGPGYSRALLKPLTFSKMIQAAHIGPEDSVLDVGCLTGYSSAVLAKLAGRVVALEEQVELAAQALNTLGSCPNVTVVTGPLADGHAADAPYDVIIIEGQAEIVPDVLLSQLKPGGRLVCVYGHTAASKIAVFTKDQEGHASPRTIADAAAPLLPGFEKPPEFLF